ncbi:MAG: hypothetical protein EOP34_07335 [Rickettsiales bacterium]|nr:MAG: hypothetical protein EOP34_07335 [Rickettsiales bacterium]
MYIVTYYFYYLEISFGKAITCVSYLERQAITCVSYLDRQAIKCVSYIDTHKKSIYMLILFVIVATVTIAVYSANILHGLYALSTLLNSSEIISDVLSNTKYFFSPSMTMLKTIDGISEEERMVGDYQNCAGPTDHATGEQQNPGYEGDHVFGTETPENFTARNDDGTTNTTEGMCEGCEQPIDYATQTYQACSDCAREWCQTCVTFIESIT